MTHQVTLQPSGLTFQVPEKTPLLDAGLNQGIALPYGCKGGVCGSCKGRVLAGEVSHDGALEQALSANERARGFTLLCCASALSDLTIEIGHVGALSEFPAKLMPARIHAMSRASADVMILQLKLPASDTFRFRPGQYIDFLLKDGQRRSFSIANAQADGILELHVRRVPGGQFTEHVFSSMRPRDIVRIEGPLGSFHFHAESTAPAIFLAGGTGFAPIKAIIEDALDKKVSRPMHLYWGAATPDGLYLDSQVRQWAAQLPSFHYIPVISSSSPSNWAGRTGLVHHALMNDYPDLSRHQVYACGSPAMIESARQDLIERCALSADAFFADAFTFSRA